MDMLDKLEWAYHTIDEQLKFGLPEEQAIKARERRVKGVLMDVIKQMKKERADLKELMGMTKKETEKPCPTIEGAQLPGFGFR